jgi:hypothetical protein
MLAVGNAWTRRVYRRLARRVADDIADYLGSGFEVVEIVGVGGSPSCGVSTTLDLDRAIAAMARVDATTDIRSANRDVVTDNVAPGRGLFIECLDRELAARGMSVLHTEHDLIAELTRAGAVATRAPRLDDTDQHRPDSDADSRTAGSAHGNQSTATRGIRAERRTRYVQGRGRTPSHSWRWRMPTGS